VGSGVPLGDEDAEEEGAEDEGVVVIDVLGLALGWPAELLPHADRASALANSAEARTAGRRRRVIVPQFTPVTGASSSYARESPDR
jgi:hypothetical protein